MRFSLSYLTLLYLSLLFQIQSISSFAQQKEHGEVYRYGRKIVDTLASPSMHGRGYVNDGDKIAAKYLENELRSFGLKNFNNTYRQEFHLSVNTFPPLDYAIAVTMIAPKGQKWLGEGQEILVHGSSPPSSGTAGIIWFDKKTLGSDRNLKKFYAANFSEKALLIDDYGITDKEQLKQVEALKNNPVHAKVVLIFNRKRLMWEVSQTVSTFPSFEILVKDSLHKAVRRQFRKAGKIVFHVDSKFIPDYQTQNLIGYIPGTEHPDSFIVFSAHYDHLGQLGPDIYFPGANDNASGCAMLLNMAKYYSMPEHKPKCSIAFMLFGAEEAGLVGSHYYTEHPLFPLKQIKFLINLDIMGTGDEGITVVNGTTYPDQFKMMQTLNEKGHFLPEVKIRGQTHNSDHYFFSEHGVKAFFIYTRGGIQAYHDIYDKAETLPLSKFEDVFHLLTGFEGWLENSGVAVSK